MKEARVPSGPIYSIKEIYEDPQFNARNMFETTSTPGGVLPIISNRLVGAPGRIIR